MKRFTFQIGSYAKARRWSFTRSCGYVFFRFGKSCISYRVAS
jgi:hypothetical protein